MASKNTRKIVRKGTEVGAFWSDDCPWCDDGGETYTDLRNEDGTFERSCAVCEKAWVIEPRYFFVRRTN